MRSAAPARIAKSEPVNEVEIDFIHGSWLGCQTGLGRRGTQCFVAFNLFGFALNHGFIPA